MGFGGLGQQTFEFRVGGGIGTVGNKFNEVESVKVIGGVKLICRHLSKKIMYTCKYSNHKESRRRCK